jgi:hypothetical protein
MTASSAGMMTTRMPDASHRHIEHPADIGIANNGEVNDYADPIPALVRRCSHHRAL